MSKNRVKKSASRSAKTGKFVKKSFADKHPSTTVTETIDTGKIGNKYTIREVARSAKTGQFVKRSFAETHPATTVVENVKISNKITIDSGPKRGKK